MIYKTVVTLLYSLAATSGFSLFLSWACSSPTESTTTTRLSGAPAAITISTTDAHPGLTFDAPVEYTYANDGTSRMFIIEQSGKIKVVDQATGAKSADTYLDIKNKVAYGGEMGLLGLAFHPKFKENGYFFVNYTKNNPRETVISRFKASSTDARQVDPASEVVLFTFRQPYSNHNGGKIAFGPDGCLYIATGDGGSGGDPQNNAQNRTVLLGKILRIDVNGKDKGQYGIPADNPYKANKDGFREEIYAYGLRNPWRFSFDKQGKLWTGDVGQNEIEEIDVVTKGGNYGWRIREGNAGYKPGEKADDPLVEPIHTYTHANGDLSVTGGYVYEGKAVPALAGKYIFADYVSGRVWALTPTGPNKATNQLISERAGTISAFGEDRAGELYLCDHAEGKILKLAK
ncbi:PQQ-dependent sugar dehydrogenase [uncultured Fibrella sp.]|uniref:PQQ-dependent sugar dehydrogenase n=1 Tax=uncultured Fibrella sp. TaxID=1284596 RepID=UPI0035CBEB32